MTNFSTLPNSESSSTFLSKAFQRFQNIFGSDPFTFQINGDCFESSLFSAVLLSPAVHEMLSHDASMTTFISHHPLHHRVTSTDLKVLSAFVWGASSSTSSSSR
jgi:hypothetical protein